MAWEMVSMDQCNKNIKGNYYGYIFLYNSGVRVLHLFPNFNLVVQLKNNHSLINFSLFVCIKMDYFTAANV